jgi:hypothetical protein
MTMTTESLELSVTHRHKIKDNLMSNDTKQNAEWLSSSQARKRLRVSSCELMHLREAGQLRFKKQGNAFLYAQDDVKHIEQESAPLTLRPAMVDSHQTRDERLGSARESESNWPSKVPARTPKLLRRLLVPAHANPPVAP